MTESPSAVQSPATIALQAAAAESLPEVHYVQLQSAGVILVYGRDQAAVEAARQLEQQLDVTVLLVPAARTASPSNLPPETSTIFPVARGVIRGAKGHLGAFEVTVDEFAGLSGVDDSELPRDGAVSHCDIILDLSGDRALFAAADLRDGYLRAHPRDPVGVQNAVARARELVGSFDKPRYISFSEERCAHSRSKIIGCTRCLDVCPAGAITSAGDHVAIDPFICAGCGQCAAVCPTGAPAYALPPTDALLRKLRTLLLAFGNAGGQGATVLLHDVAHGDPLIAEARSEAPWPAHVLPFRVHEITQINLETLIASFIFGAVAVRVLSHAHPAHDLSGLQQTLALTECIVAALGFDGARIAMLQADEPNSLRAELTAMVPLPPASRISTWMPMSADKRAMVRSTLRELHKVAPLPIDVAPLPRGAPFGAVHVDVAGCTLCLACVSACPAGALGDNAEQPMLRFTEANCIQCGLCKATCPEQVITLEPRLDFRAEVTIAHTLKSEEPFCCIRCGKAFGIKSTIERVIKKLAGKHWMFKESSRQLDLIRMCEDCRVVVVTEENFDPHAAPRAPVRTADDYPRESEARRTLPKEDQ